jgi:hypothetical protein
MKSLIVQQRHRIPMTMFANSQTVSFATCSLASISD